MEDKPEIEDRLIFYWDAFHALSAARQSGMNGPQAISLAEVASYCSMASVADPTARMTLLEMVQAMDGAYLEVSYEKIAKDQKGKGGA